MAQRKKVLFKFIILGDSQVGKTKLMTKYVQDRFSNQYKATIGADFLSKEEVVNDRICTLQIWDTAGQERFQSLGVAFYRGSDACLLVYDTTNKASFDNLQQWKDEFVAQAHLAEGNKFAFLLIGTKCDSENRVITPAQGRQWAKDNGCCFFETDSKTGKGVKEAFVAATRLTINSQGQLDGSRP